MPTKTQTKLEPWESASYRRMLERRRLVLERVASGFQLKRDGEVQLPNYPMPNLQAVNYAINFLIDQ